jgi:hypothetical protein
MRHVATISSRVAQVDMMAPRMLPRDTLRRPQATASFILALAGIYNVLWGTIAVLAPDVIPRLVGVDLAGQRWPWQCIGMLVGVYGIAYWIAARDPGRHWPIVLVGLIGKVLGPIGAVVAIRNGDLPQSFLWVNVGNDLIWIAPFAWILLRASAGALDPREPRRGSLYQRLLGESFDDLSPRVRAFHAATTPIELAGTFAVERGEGWLANTLASLVRFPPATSGREVRLRVVPGESGEAWERDFDATRLTSWQGEAHGLLTERFGPLVLFLRPRVDRGALEIVDVRATLLGFPLPALLSPRIHARAIDDGDAMRVEVDVAAPLIGRLVRYSGHVRIVGSPHA